MVCHIWDHMSNHMWSNHMWNFFKSYVVKSYMGNHIWSSYTCTYFYTIKWSTQLHSNHIWESYVVSYVFIMHGAQIWSYVVKAHVFKSHVDIFQIICYKIIYEQSHMIVTYLHILLHYEIITQLHSNHTWESHMINIYMYTKWISITFKSYMEITYGAIYVNHIFNIISSV